MEKYVILYSYERDILRSIFIEEFTFIRINKIYGSNTHV